MEVISGHIELEATVRIITTVSCIYTQINVNDCVSVNPERTAAFCLLEVY
jgi:hypothetical protein